MLIVSYKYLLKILQTTSITCEDFIQRMGNALQCFQQPTIKQIPLIYIPLEPLQCSYEQKKYTKGGKKLSRFNETSDSFSYEPECIHNVQIIQQVSMILELLLAIAGLWLVASLAAYFIIKKSFKKYKNYPRLEYDEKTEPIVRKDLAKWDEAAILKGCFLRFPLHTLAMAGFLSGYAFVAGMQKYLKYPDWVVNGYRLNMGRLATHICFNLVEEFDHTEKSTTPIVISNHVSWIDFIYMGTCLFPVSFLAKKEIQKVFVFNTIADSVKALYVDRSSPEARHRIKEQILERVNEYKNNPTGTNPLIIYPEGTVTNGRSIISFKNGAFEPLVPITILCLKYQCKQFHMGLDEIAALDHGLFAMCLTPTLRVKRTIVQPKESETVEDYRERCRQQLANLSGFKLYDSDFRDLLGYENKLKALLKERRNAAR